MKKPISECQRNFGTPPRSFSIIDRISYLNISCPSWLKSNKSNSLYGLLQNSRQVFQEGKIVWSYLVQANTLLFESGDDDCLGEVVYSLKDAEDIYPEYLLNLASKLYMLKENTPQNKELLSIAEHMKDEMTPIAEGMNIPTIMSPDFQCRTVTTFFTRKHLPKKRLCASLIPLVVSTKEPFWALPLPSRYWPSSFVDWWEKQEDNPTRHRHHLPNWFVQESVWENLIRKYLDRDFNVHSCGSAAPLIDVINDFEKELGYSLPDDFKQYSISPIGGLYAEVKENLWPRSKENEVAPSWSFSYGLAVYGFSKDVPSWMNMKNIAADFRSITKSRNVPFLEVMADADRLCFTPERSVVRWNHETEEFILINQSFTEILDNELKELRERKEKKLSLN